MARILVVDDEPDTRGLIELTLHTAGHEVRTAANGAEAIEMLGQETFDLVILDVMMPDVSGYDVMRKLRGLAEAPPVIFLTAKGRAEDRQTGRSLGAVGYLVKPVSRGELLDAVAAALGAEAA